MPPKSKILIVDDVNFFLDVQRKMLDQVDCDIFTARSGLEALKVIKKEKPQLVLLDYHMPDLIGSRTCEIIKKDPRFKDIAIIIVSSHNKKEVEEECLAAGADVYLTKPIDQTRFIEAVSSLLKLRSSLYYPRSLIRAEVYVRHNGEVKKYMSVDISVTGIYLETTEPLPMDDTATLHFTIPIPKRDVKVNARVVKTIMPEDMRKYGLFPGMAFEFLNLDLEDRRYIEHYIEQAMSMRKYGLTDKNNKIHFV